MYNCVIVVLFNKSSSKGGILKTKFEELTPEEVRQNKDARKGMVLNAWYKFSSDVKVVPIRRRSKDSLKKDVPIIVSEGQYYGFKFNEHIFFCINRQGCFLVPLFIYGDFRVRRFVRAFVPPDKEIKGKLIAIIKEQIELVDCSKQESPVLVEPGEYELERVCSSATAKCLVIKGTQFGFDEQIWYAMASETSGFGNVVFKTT